MALMPMGPESKEPETELGRFLMPRMKARKLNKSTFAAELGTIYPTVQAWFTAKKNALPKLAMLEKISETLQLSPREREQLLAIARGARQLSGEEPYSVPGTETLPVAERTVAYRARYNNASVALRRLREAGEAIGDDVAAEIEDGWKHFSEEDPPVAIWTEVIKAYARRRRELLDVSLEQMRKQLGGVAAQAGDVAAPKVKNPKWSRSTQ